MEIKPTKNRIFLERIKKESLLATQGEQRYDYEDYKFKVIALGKDVEDKTLLGKTIVKSKQIGLDVKIEGKEIVIIREDDILAS